MGQPNNFTRTLIIRRVGRVKTPNPENPFRPTPNHHHLFSGRSTKWQTKSD